MIETTLEEIKHILSGFDQRLCGVEKNLFGIKNCSPQTNEFPDKITIDEAIVYIRNQGIPITKSELYKRSHEKSVPCERFGKRLVFSRQALNQWIESKLVKKLPENEIMSEHLAVMANKKIK